MSAERFEKLPYERQRALLLLDFLLRDGHVTPISVMSDYTVHLIKDAPTRSVVVEEFSASPEVLRELDAMVFAKIKEVELGSPLAKAMETMLEIKGNLAVEKAIRNSRLSQRHITYGDHRST